MPPIEATRGDEDRVHFTIGTFSVSPGSVNTIPDHVTFSIDLRHPEAATLKALEATFNQLPQQTWAGLPPGLSRSRLIAKQVAAGKG